VRTGHQSRLAERQLNPRLRFPECDGQNAAQDVKHFIPRHEAAAAAFQLIERVERRRQCRQAKVRAEPAADRMKVPFRGQDRRADCQADRDAESAARSIWRCVSWMGTRWGPDGSGPSMGMPG